MIPGKPFRTFKKGEKVPAWLMRLNGEAIFNTDVEIYHGGWNGKPCKFFYELYPAKEVEEGESVILITGSTGDICFTRQTTISVVPARTSTQSRITASPGFRGTRDRRYT